MIKSPNTITLTDQGENKNDIAVHANFNKLTPEKVQITLAGNSAIIDIKDLFSAVFVLCDEDMQAQLVPSRKFESHKYRKQHTIVLQKDMKKGEHVVANCVVDVPLILEEALKNPKLPA